MSEALPQQTPEAPPVGLSDEERTNLGRMLGFPLDLPASFVTWLEGRMQLLLSAGNIQGLQTRLACVGDLKVVCLDLSAETALYPYDDAQGTWLYCNGNSFTAAVYPKLNTFLGGLVLPDARGRSIWMTGTNAATDLLDNDGVAEASRQPKHEHTSAGLTVTGLPGISGAPSAGTLAITPDPHSHTIGNEDTATTAGAGRIFGSAANNAVTNTTSLSITGAPGIGTLAGTLNTLDVGGTGGSGMAGSDAVAHCVVGSLLIKAD